MDLGLKGKVALVAGGSMGLGRAVAWTLAQEGAKLAICALDDPALPETAAFIKRDTGEECLAIPADVSRPEEARRFVCDAWTAGFRLNLLSTIVMTREAVPVMKKKKWGRIINMTSISVKQPIDGLILSNTVRSGVIGLAKSLSNELAPYNITVNNVCPGYTLTDRVRNLARSVAEKEGTTPEAVIRGWESAVPMGRLGTPEEFAALVAFLASSQAGYITGAAIQIDGGWYKGVM